MTYTVMLANGKKLKVNAYNEGTEAEARERVKFFYPDAEIKSISPDT